MRTLAPTSRTLLGAALVAAVALAAPTPALAKKGKETYVFRLTKVEAKKGTPDAAEAVIRERVSAAIDAHDELLSSWPEDAPDPKKDPDAFEKFLERRNIRAFKVNVEITEYEMTEEDNPSKSGKVLTAHIAIRMFGETIPQRVMAFTGDGSATVKIETGKTVRDKDRQFANHDAADMAVADAIAASLKKLKQPPPSKRKRKR